MLWKRRNERIRDARSIPGGCGASLRGRRSGRRAEGRRARVRGRHRCGRTGAGSIAAVAAVHPAVLPRAGRVPCVDRDRVRGLVRRVPRSCCRGSRRVRSRDDSHDVFVRRPCQAYRPAVRKALVVRRVRRCAYGVHAVHVRVHLDTEVGGCACRAGGAVGRVWHRARHSAVVGTVRLSQSVSRRAVLFGVHDRGGAPHLFVQRLAVTVARRRRARAARRVACRLRGGVPLVAFRRASARQAVEVFVPLEDRAAHGHLRVRVRAEGIVDVPVDVRPAFGVRHAGGGRYRVRRRHSARRQIRLRCDLPHRVAAHGGGFPHLAERGRPGAGRVRFLHECVLHRVLHPHHAHHG